MTTVDQAEDRSRRLAGRVAALRTRSSAGGYDRWLLVIGGVLMPLGVLLVILGWAGAAQTPLPFEQTDYLISGGLLGLALVIAGGFVYFAYWQTVRIRESRDQARQLTAAIRGLEAMLTVPTAAVVAPAVPAMVFVATATGSIYHRRDCQSVASRADLVSVDPANTKLRPCRICEPQAAGE